MISNDRIRERDPFLSDSKLRNTTSWDYLFPTTRQALYAFLGAAPQRSVLLPEYVPEGVYDPFRRKSTTIHFYPVDCGFSLDKERIKQIVSAESPDAFVYIHYFGVYNESDIKMVRALLPSSTILIEDFAHTLPGVVKPIGDITLFSFPKMIGVEEGGMLRFERETIAVDPPPYVAIGNGLEELRKRLRWKLSIDSFCVHITSSRIEALIRKLLRSKMNYYPYISEHYTSIFGPLASKSIDILDRIDFDRITARRRHIARLYLESIDSRMLIDLPESCYTSQALYSFPIRTSNQKKLHNFLLAKGVRGSVLRDHWWFKDTICSNTLLNEHYLLPINHYLSDKQISHVVKVVNAYARKCFASDGNGL